MCLPYCWFRQWIHVLRQFTDLRSMSLLVASPEKFRKSAVSVLSPYAWFDSGLSIMRQSTAVGDFHTFLT